LQTAGLVAIGSGGDRIEAETTRILERQGIKVAFLGFTDIFNIDLNRKATEPWVRALDLGPAVEAVRGARRQADVVVVSIHWGNEYQHVPTKRQKEIAHALVEAGCDVILGHHPHVLQSAEIIEAGTRKAFVAYSLGNFISNQDRMYQADLFPVAGGDNRDGAAVRIRFARQTLTDGATQVGLDHVAIEPLWTENNWGQTASRREIRVIRVGAAEAQVRGELDRLADPAEGPKVEPDEARRRKLILEKQEYLRTLILRRRRVAEVVGESFVTAP
jgi:poly-gamma-glutamate synthesis protein (capsule biosynthesis protein)